MVYVISGGIIFGTHYLLKENQWLLKNKLWQLILGAILIVGVAIIVSTWIGSLFPVIGATLVCSTMLQIKYTHQMASQRLA
ncbi:hypothetical protein ATZ33_14795 [Enterococcus silesiacus]|uniref:Uncharacterized protein n=1 Tax=Enterococcus silesiacus TaxID=332949 RepID=A0A0S3KEG1_9ENTE|nr:hypothetical protein [Enterococcus silesiacus]ALS02596.1 hypothetical protein ATZ33_14795 [Enterococcus silesiacus]OJG93479.1 hypothetical protein RV15_GL000081 [Enterococcus silesiacus]